jgi:murein DD-endopeptidase MepM/ murein hydrolase activator NlpD
MKAALRSAKSRVNRAQAGWSALLLLALLAAGCAPGGYWIPPSSEATPDLSYLLETPTPFVQSDPWDDAPPSATPAIVEPISATIGGTGGAGLVTPTPGGMITTPILYYVQAADTLPVVAVRFSVLPEEITSPQPIDPVGLLPPGQLLLIPRRLANTTSPQHLLPDSEVVYSPSAVDFDVAAYVRNAGGKLATYTEWLKSTGTTTGADIILRVAAENSINPRLLLALLEYQSGWVLGRPATLAQSEYPLGLVNLNEKGLYKQLVWAVNQLSIGYYAWREGRLTEIAFSDGSSTRLAPDLNAGSAALQYFFSKQYSGQAWLDALSMQRGLPALHERMFGSPWERALRVEPLYPPGLAQPPMILPFVENMLWSYTGGPHGAWEHDGSYAALDFAPASSEPGCVKSDAWVTASAAGKVVRSGNGVVVLDLDNDGYEQTGWVLLYLHVSAEQRIPVGANVDQGDKLGHPSCEGGMATGTHLHIARKYNGEWMAAAGPLPFNLSGWLAYAGDLAYQGRLERDGKVVEACTCSSFQTRIMRTPDDPY